MNSAQIGTIAGVLFGCAWGIAGTLPLPPVWRTAGILESLAVSALLVLFIYRAQGSAGGYFNGAIYGIAVTAEVVAIVIAGVILSRTGRSTLIPPVVAVIVGLHFIGLWRAMGSVSFLWLAGALCAVGLFAAAMRPGARLPATGIGSALSLWGAALSTLVHL